MSDLIQHASLPILQHNLRRLIKPEEAAGLLTPFLKLMPGVVFGMLDPFGERYAGSDVWEQPVILDAWKHAQSGETTRDGPLFLRPLVVHNQLAGALLVLDRVGSADLDHIFPLIDAVGNGFVRLLEQAVEKRDLGSELLDRYREINLLYRAAETIGSTLNPERIPRLVLDQIESVVPSDMSLVMLSAESEADMPESKAGYGLVESAWDGEPGVTDSLRAAAGAIIDRVMNSGESFIFNPESTSLVRFNEEVRPGIVLGVPLKVHERTLGVLLLGRLKQHPEFTAGDEKLVSALAGQAAIALETARLHQEEVKLQRLEEEMLIGRQIQLSFLPESLPEIPGWEFAAAYRSARQVGGDLYDLIYSQDNPARLNIVIADVTGKGVAAALFMAFARTVLRLTSIEGGSPGEVLRKANHYILQERRKAVFMSAFFLSLDLNSGKLNYANAGHDWPLLLERQTGSICRLEATGYLLGAFGEIEPDEFQTTMKPGDLLVLYTDGVSEAFNPQNELYGTKRLEALVSSRIWTNADDLLNSILEDVERFTNEEPQSDDLTLLVVRRLEGGQDGAIE